jgi:hypothetical protein
MKHHQNQPPPPPPHYGGPGGPGFNQPGYNQPGFNQPQSLFNPNQDYIILTALNKNRALDVSQGHDKGSCLIWDKHGNPNQRYRLRAAGNRYQICPNSGGQLQVPNGNNSNGIQIMAGSVGTAPNQTWEIVPVQGHGANAYYIKSFCGKVLDVAGNKDHNGGKVHQWDFNGQANQVWIIQPI